ncbi:hypothetical protein ACFC1R_23530 [Kitasatospora sp. NPDC056138]
MLTELAVTHNASPSIAAFARDGLSDLLTTDDGQHLPVPVD